MLVRRPCKDRNLSPKNRFTTLACCSAPSQGLCLTRQPPRRAATRHLLQAMQRQGERLGDRDASVWMIIARPTCSPGSPSPLWPPCLWMRRRIFAQDASFAPLDLWASIWGTTRSQKSMRTRSSPLLRPCHSLETHTSHLVRDGQQALVTRLLQSTHCRSGRSRMSAQGPP